MTTKEKVTDSATEQLDLVNAHTLIQIAHLDAQHWVNEREWKVEQLQPYRT